MAAGGGEEFNGGDFNIEFSTHICPPQISSELISKYGVNLLGESGHMSAITICHRTTNCMTVWNEEVMTERNKLGDILIQTAKDICLHLFNHNEWADFINPKTARPFYGKHLDIRFIETDPRYLLFGFEFQKVGPCQVVKHAEWGTHAYVTSIFTSAPHQSEYLLEVLEEIKLNFKRN